MVGKVYKDRIYKLLETASPEDVYDMVLNGTLKQFPRYFWSMPENYAWARLCIKHLIEDILKWSKEEVCSSLTIKVFKEYKLYGMLGIYTSMFAAIDDTYPGEYKPWEFSSVPMGFWTDDNNKIAAVKWLIEDKLKWNREQVCSKLSFDTFRDNGLYGLIYTNNNMSTVGSPFYLLNLAYPNEYKQWELSKVGQGFWSDDNNKIAAVKWLIEDKLKWDREQVCSKLNFNTFMDNLCGLVTNSQVNMTPYQLLNLAYPGIYRMNGYKLELNTIEEE